MLTRIAKLKGFNQIMVGRDLNNVFKDGHVYEFKEILGQIIVEDLGPHYQIENFSMQPLDVILIDGKHCFTKKEFETTKIRKINS